MSDGNPDVNTRLPGVSIEKRLFFYMAPPMAETVTDLTKGVYRRLYSGFTKGQRINRLSLQAEAWFWRIVATVDDFGNGDADPELCRAATAGRRQSVTAKQISGWLDEMHNVGLISFYTVDGEPFLHVVGFEESQPAGKNGRRIQRFRQSEGIQVNPGESKIIQGNPDVVSASYSEDDSYSDNDPESRSHAAKPRSTSQPKLCDEEYLENLQARDAYALLDVRLVHSKMVIWCENKGKIPTRGRLINWLNREDPPMGAVKRFDPARPVNDNGNAPRPITPVPTVTAEELAQLGITK